MMGILAIETPLSNTTYELSPQLAYVLVFDANNKCERRKFLKMIIKDSYLAFSFIRYCNPDSDELKIAFDAMLNNIKACYEYLRYCDNEEYYHNETFNKILQDCDFSYLTAKHCILSYEEKKQIYEKYSNIYSNTQNVQDYFEFCIIFEDLISDSEKESLVDKILVSENDSIALTILKSGFKLTELLKDKLESVLLIRKLILT